MALSTTVHVAPLIPGFQFVSGRIFVKSCFLAIHGISILLSDS